MYVITCVVLTAILLLCLLLIVVCPFYRLWALAPHCAFESEPICVHLCLSVFICALSVYLCPQSLIWLAFAPILVELICQSIPKFSVFFSDLIIMSSTTTNLTLLYTSIPKFSGDNWVSFKKDIEVFFQLDGTRTLCQVWRLGWGM